MGRRKKRKISSTLTWKATKGFFRLVFQGVVKASPLLLSGGLGLGIFWGIRENLYADPGFLIRTVEVRPEGLLSPSALQGLEKRFLNQNLFKVSLRAVSQALEQDPTIREARASREFPSTLRIQVAQRTPFFQIQFYPKGPYFSAGEDRILLEKDSARDRNLLLVEAFQVKGIKTEVKKELSLPGLSEGIGLAKAFWAHPLAQSETLERMRLDPLGNISLVLREGPELRFGRHPMKRFQALEMAVPLLKAPDRNRIVYIDLEYQDLIVRKR